MCLNLCVYPRYASKGMPHSENHLFDFGFRRPLISDPSVEFVVGG